MTHLNIFYGGVTLIITGTIRVESEEELARIKDALIRRAKRSREDEGNIDYAFAYNMEDPTEIHLTEKWDSEASLNAYLQIVDEEFSAVISSAKVKSAVVISYDAFNEREVLNR